MSPQPVTGMLGLFLILAWAPLYAQQAYAFNDSQAFVKTYCQTCHQGKTAPGRLDLSAYSAADAIGKDPRIWGRVFERVRDSSMPPKGAPAPNADQREKFTGWLETTLRASICSNGFAAGLAPIRRLNRVQYTTTIRDLLNIAFEAGRALPEDGAGGEGFDNAAETLFLSPIHAEKYLEAAKESLNFAFKNPKTRSDILISSTDARTIFEKFLPRAFRRPVAPGDVERYLAVFNAARKRGESFDYAIQYTLQAVLISPDFLFRIELPNTTAAPRLLGDYEIASRLSYFLWDSMPDQALFDLAAKGKLHEPAILKEQIERMLEPGVRGVEDDVRTVKGGKAEAFAQQFIEQWLETRELGRDIKPDPALFPTFYETELQSAIRLEPVLFMRELLMSNLSLLNLIDSRFAMLNVPLVKHYGFNLRVGAQPARTALPENSHRGGLLGMTAVLAVSSYHNRTSPVLRGKWVLEALLGTPPPPPPPNVPALEEAHPGQPGQTVRERLAQHRKDPACASCHSRIDPLGFGLENYDVLGRWRTEESGGKIDAKGELPDGTKFDGPEELKKVLLDRKDVFIRNLTSKMLGYALGRGLTLEDSCTVDAIVEKLKQNDYLAQTLVTEIVLSTPFRYQAPAVVTRSEQKPVTKPGL